MESISDIKACLLRETGGGAHFTLAIDTLLRYGQNMSSNPEDDKFKRVNGKNPKYVERIGRYPAGVRLMEKLGFKSGVEEGKLIASEIPSSTVINEIKGKCEQTCDTPAMNADAAAAAPPSEVASKEQKIIPQAPPSLKISPQPPTSELKETPRNADDAAPAPEPSEEVNTNADEAAPKPVKTPELPKAVLKLRIKSDVPETESAEPAPKAVLKLRVEQSDNVINTDEAVTEPEASEDSKLLNEAPKQSECSKSAETAPKAVLKHRVTPGSTGNSDKVAQKSASKATSVKKTGDGPKRQPKNEDISKREVEEAKVETLPSPKSDTTLNDQMKSKPRTSPIPPAVAVAHKQIRTPATNLVEVKPCVELKASMSTTRIVAPQSVLVETSVVTRIATLPQKSELVESSVTTTIAVPNTKPATRNQSTMKTPPPPSPPTEPEETDFWACVKCTFHNELRLSNCDMCGTEKVGSPQFADAQCSPVIPVPEELSRITATSTVDVGVGQTPLQTADSGCSPIIMQHNDASCSANLRNVKTPVDNEACLEEGLLRVRKRLAELCRGQNANGQPVQPALSDLTNSAINRNKNATNNNNGPSCPSQPTSRAGSTGVLRRELTGTLECGVCLCLMVYPVSTPCGHTFCRHCLAESMCKTGKKCPTCRGACDFDAMKYPENKMLAEAAKLANPSEYSSRKKEADEVILKLRKDACETTTLPVLIGDDCPCPGSTCKLQLAERRDVDLLRYISANGGKFILLPSSEGSRVRKGAVGLSCSIRRAEDLPNGHAAASVNVGHRILVVKHSTAPEGHTNADVLKHEDSNESSYEALAAVHHLKKILKEFFHSQGHGVQRQVERFAGPEPVLPALPPTRTEGISLGATRYSFWAAAVMSHLRVLSKRLKPSIVTQKDCVSRATSLCHIIGATMRSGLVSRQPSGLHRYEAGGRREVRAA